jgi:HD-GYP domain-containing protein (c-di-GMP phosphodiesterase class II)
MINAQNDYKDIKNRLGNLMDTIKKNQTVPLETYNLLANDINTKLELTDPTFIIDCINNMRDPDDYLNAHSTNVGMLNGMIGAWLRLPKDDIDVLIKIGLYHDIGKLRVPVEILNKPGSLTDDEFAEMKKHTIYSYEILGLSGETNTHILEGVLSHHEKINGTGYPSGLPMTQISQFARVTSVSDVYDAMVAKRAYKNRHSPFEILAEFALNRFSDLDISIVNIFLENLPTALIGKNVLLSDGRSAEVVYINPRDFAHPMVKLDGELLSIGSGLECVAMVDFLVSVDD